MKASYRSYLHNTTYSSVQTQLVCLFVHDKLSKSVLVSVCVSIKWHILEGVTGKHTQLQLSAAEAPRVHFIHNCINKTVQEERSFFFFTGNTHKRCCRTVHGQRCSEINQWRRVVPSSGRAVVSVGTGQQLATFGAQLRFIGRIQREALKCDPSAAALLDFVDTDSMTDHNGNANAR